MAPEDADIVQDLLEKDHWPRRSRHGWQWALADNPARVQLQAPTGWVLTADDAVVGCLANVPHLYHWQGQALAAATCTYFYVEPPWRGQASALMRAFFLQKNVQLFFSASANTFGAPFYRLFKANPTQDPGVNLNLIWLGCPVSFARQALNRFRLGRVPLLAQGLGSLVRGFARLSGRGMVPVSGVQARVSTVRLGEIDHRLDTFWSQLRKGPGMHLDRSAATVRWRMSDPDIHEDLGLLVLETPDGTVLGTAMLMNRHNFPGATPRAIVLDWSLLHTCTEEHSNALLAGAVRWARERQLPMLDARRITGHLGQWLRQANPVVRTLAPDTHWTKTTVAGLAECLASDDGWRSVNVDGDEWVNLADYQERPGRNAWTPRPP